mmetsp:Transcript_21977/g.51260  ORF Transcript_21977/g.51260 Transcript_21977/m.51260 type:complete len:96 (+) Transcript_21977:195-482(+)
MQTKLFALLAGAGVNWRLPCVQWVRSEIVEKFGRASVLLLMMEERCAMHTGRQEARQVECGQHARVVPRTQLEVELRTFWSPHKMYEGWLVTAAR